MVFEVHLRGYYLRGSYANGKNIIPLTFSSPNLIRMYPKPLGALEIEYTLATVVTGDQCLGQGIELCS